MPPDKEDIATPCDKLPTSGLTRPKRTEGCHLPFIKQSSHGTPVFPYMYCQILVMTIPSPTSYASRQQQFGVWVMR